MKMWCQPSISITSVENRAIFLCFKCVLIALLEQEEIWTLEWHSVVIKDRERAVQDWNNFKVNMSQSCKQ
jgi:hypothetical protein